MAEKQSFSLSFTLQQYCSDLLQLQKASGLQGSCGNLPSVCDSCVTVPCLQASALPWWPHPPYRLGRPPLPGSQIRWSLGILAASW